MAERLARFNGVVTGDARTFGAGAAQAEVRYRAETVAHGYLAVLDSYVDPVTGATWCTLTVTLPARVPTLTIDHRAALGRPGVPACGAHVLLTGGRDFDAAYLVTADDPAVVSLVSPGVQQVLLGHPVQRLALHGAGLALRTFDGAQPSGEVTAWLERVAAAVLGALPAFVTPMGTRTFPPGLYGPNAEVASAARRSSHRGVFARLAGRQRVKR